MIIRHCPDYGCRMNYKCFVKDMNKFTEGIVAYGSSYHLCPKCFTAVDFKFRSKWKEVDQNA